MESFKLNVNKKDSNRCNSIVQWVIPIIFFLTFIQIPVNLKSQDKQDKRYPTENISRNDLEAKFLQLCDLSVQELKLPLELPLRMMSQDLPKRKTSFWSTSYTIRALGVAYDMTGKEEYLNTMKRWSDEMITYQEKMIPKGIYYMNYGRKPFEVSGPVYNADGGEIAMGILATAARCTNKMEKDRYLNSVKAYAKLILENYIGKRGGIVNGNWDYYSGEWYCSTAYAGQVLFWLYDETGERDYLEAGLNAVNWLSNLEQIGKQFPADSQFRKSNLPSGKRFNGSWVHMYFGLYISGFSHIFSGNYPAIEEDVRREIDILIKLVPENLAGKGYSDTFAKYDVRDGRTGGKSGAVPFALYYLSNNNMCPDYITQIADKEMYRIVNELFSYDELRITELASFAMFSMSEKLYPGVMYRKSRPLYAKYEAEK